jgi:hypothetical protein
MQPAVNQGGHRQGARRQGGHSGQERAAAKDFVFIGPNVFI